MGWSLIRNLFLGEGRGSDAQIEGMLDSKPEDLRRTYGARLEFDASQPLRAGLTCDAPPALESRVIWADG